MLETFCDFYETFCDLNEENLILKEVSNDEMFTEKNKAIEELRKERNNLLKEKEEMLTLEETEKVMKWYARHVVEDDGVHKPICKMYYGPIGSSREIQCSCGASFDLEDWQSW